MSKLIDPGLKSRIVPSKTTFSKPVFSTSVPEAQIPTTRTPAVRTPAVRTPPVRTPPVRTPPVRTPPVRTPPVRTPVVIKSPAVRTPPVRTPVVIKSPAVRTPPVRTPPVRTPVVIKSPAARTPAVRTPAARTPAVRTPAARTPAARTPAARTPAARTPAARTPAARTPAARTPAARPPVRTPVVRIPAVRTPQTKEGKDSLNVRLKLLNQLRNGTIKLSDKKFVVGENLFILAKQPCDFAKIIMKHNRNSSIKFITEGASSYIFQYCADNSCNIDYVIKIIPYKLERETIPFTKLAIEDLTRPENVDFYMAQLLAKLVYAGYTPHINLSALAFRCNKYNTNILKMFIGTENEEQYKLIEEEERETRYLTFTDYVNGKPIEKISGKIGEKYIALVTEFEDNKKELKNNKKELEELKSKIYIGENSSEEEINELSRRIEVLNANNHQLEKDIKINLEKIVMRGEIEYESFSRDKVLVYFAEWAKYGTLKDYLKLKIGALNVKILLFQIIYTMAVIQRVYPSWKHNDFHRENILIQKIENPIVHYQFERNNFIIPTIDASAMFWDYDHARSNEVKNSGWVNRGSDNQIDDLIELFISIQTGRFLLDSDTNIFINTLTRPEYITDPGETLAKIYFRYRNKEAVLTRISLDQFTPEFILLNDYYFNEFRRISMTGITTGEFYHYP